MKTIIYLQAFVILEIRRNFLFNYFATAPFSQHEGNTCIYDLLDQKTDRAIFLFEGPRNYMLSTSQ